MSGHSTVQTFRHSCIWMFRRSDFCMYRCSVIHKEDWKNSHTSDWKCTHKHIHSSVRSFIKTYIQSFRLLFVCSDFMPVLCLLFIKWFWLSEVTSFHHEGWTYVLMTEWLTSRTNDWICKLNISHSEKDYRISDIADHYRPIAVHCLPDKSKPLRGLLRTYTQTFIRPCQFSTCRGWHPHIFQRPYYSSWLLALVYYLNSPTWGLEFTSHIYTHSFHRFTFLIMAYLNTRQGMLTGTWNQVSASQPLPVPPGGGFTPKS